MNKMGLRSITFTNITIKKKLCIISTLSIFSIIIIFNCLNPTIIIPVSKKNTSSNLPNSSQLSEDYDILDFWNDEINRVNAINLNISYGKSVYFGGYSGDEIYFDSPNYVDAEKSILRIQGYIFYPKNQQSVNPGAIIIHGIFGNANDSFNYAIQYLQKGVVALCFSLPGHGESEGERPNPDNLYFKNGIDYNKSFNFYLGLCSAIQALRLMEGLPSINNSEIMVSGISYGALVTMWLGSICGDRISGLIPMIMVGDLGKLKNYEWSLFWYLWQSSPDNIDSSFENVFLPYWDPIYYLKSTNLPPILWIVGTSDEFYYYKQISSTYSSVIHQEDEFLLIIPNMHHELLAFQNSTSTFINYILSEGPKPLKISVLENNIHLLRNIQGDNLQISLNFNSETSSRIENVEIVYYFSDIIGAKWESIQMQKLNETTWRGVVNPSIFSSNIEYYIQVTLNNGDQAKFSSIIYHGGKINSNLSYIIISLIALICILPSILIIKKRIKDDKEYIVDEKTLVEYKKYLTIEISLLVTMEVLFYISLLLPLVTSKYGLTWSHVYIFDRILTWKSLLGDFVNSIQFLIIIIWIIGFLVSIRFPIGSLLIKIIYPLLSAFLASYLVMSANPDFGGLSYGYGLYLMFIFAISPLLIGLWKNKYQKKLDLL